MKLPSLNSTCISGVKVKESPEWLKNRLNSIGGEEVYDWLNKPMEHTYREGVLKKIWEKANQGDFKFVQLLAYLGCLDG